MEINWLGAETLFKKEVRRFLKVYNQTLIAPTVTAMLFFAIFYLALGGKSHQIKGIQFGSFMGAGLIMMAAMQNAFANSSSSLVMGKVIGPIIDILMPPLSSGEILAAMTLAAALRGLIVGTLVAGSLMLFTHLDLHSLAVALFYIVISSLILALLGVLCGIFAETFDQMSAITSYIITPLTFLSGTFYSVNDLPKVWHSVSHINPFFYMIDGFRYAITGHNDGNLLCGAIFLIFFAISLTFFAYYLLKTGYRIKS